MTTVEVVSVYNIRTVAAKVHGAEPIEVDPGEFIVPTRITATYGKLGDQWDVIAVRVSNLAAHDDALLALRSDWPEWLVRFVDENLPETDEQPQVLVNARAGRVDDRVSRRHDVPGTPGSD